MHVYPFLWLLLLSFCFLNFSPIAPFLNVPANFWRTCQRRTDPPTFSGPANDAHGPASEMYNSASMYFIQNSPADPDLRTPPPPSRTTLPLLRWRGEGGLGAGLPARASQNRYFTLLPHSQRPTYACALYIHTGWKNHLKKCSQIYCI